MEFLGLKKIRSDYINENLFPVKTHKRILGIVLTSVGWLLIALTSIQAPSNKLEFYNTCFYQFLVAFMVLAIWTCFKGKPYLFSKNPAGIALNSTLCFVCYISYFLLRVSHPHQINAFFLNSNVFIVTLVAAFFFKQKIHKLVWLGLTVCLVGLFLFTFPGVTQNTASHNFMPFSTLSINNGFIPWFLKNLYGLFYALTISFLILSTNYLIRNGNHPLLICLYNCLIGFFAFGSLAWITTGLHMPTGSEILYIAATGILYAIAICLFTTAHRYTEVHIIMPLNFLVPVFLLLIQSLLKKEALSFPCLINSLLIFLGLALTIGPSFFTEKSTNTAINSPMDTAA